MLSKDKQGFIEMPENEAALRELKVIRRTDSRFAHARIKAILQLSPSQVPMGEYVKVN